MSLQIKRGNGAPSLLKAGEQYLDIDTGNVWIGTGTENLKQLSFRGYQEITATAELLNDFPTSKVIASGDDVFVNGVLVLPSRYAESIGTQVLTLPADLFVNDVITLKFR